MAVLSWEMRDVGLRLGTPIVELAEEQEGQEDLNLCSSQNCTCHLHSGNRHTKIFTHFILCPLTLTCSIRKFESTFAVLYCDAFTLATWYLEWIKFLKRLGP